jgi:hypothetical protein
MLAASLLVLASGAEGYQYWNYIRHSALLPDNGIEIRVENPSGAGIENYLLYAGAGIVEQSMTPIVDGPATIAASVPGPVSAARYYGFRLIQGGELDLMPVRIADGASPAPSDLTRLALDPSGDHLYSYVNLDLVECRVSFSGTKIFAALKNAGGGFPVSTGLTFFGYLLAIADPAAADPDTVFALMQTLNQPGVISPGLYKIIGTGLSGLTKIGNVVAQEFPAENTLLLSCDLADLMADPYFMSWYDPADPAIGVAGFTQRITLLGGAVEADRTPGGRCRLRELAIAPAANQLPELSELSFEGSGAGAYAQLSYSDANGDCPVAAEIVFDGGAPYPMYPQSLDYGSPVQYRSAAGIEPLANDSWSRAVARFSDNISDTVTAEAATTGVDGDRAIPPLRALAAPNPFSAFVAIEIEARAGDRVSVNIFDVRGALVRTLWTGAAGAGARRMIWDGRDERGLPCSSGLYFCRISSSREAITQKLLKVR